MKKLLILLAALYSFSSYAQGPDKYLAQIRKYNEASVFEDERYKDMTWEKFYHLDEANDLVDPNNYDFDLLNAAVLFAVNKYRDARGIKALKFEPRLRDAASIHSYEMVRRNFFDHVNRYDKAIAMPNNRTEMCKYAGERIAENLARSFVDVEKPMTYTQIADMIVKELSTSYDHNKHMLDPGLDKIGCAVIFEDRPIDGYYYMRTTQDFGRDWH
ncbi:MAG: CAP domain-containing protein [Bacteroidetes bacterium]|nr:CAP domain-containing protein [Bacteroidota bacterium]